MKKISKILLSSIVCSSMLYGASYEYPQLYKDQKTMGMGGASTATGGTSASLFSNPAGLSKIPKSYGWEFNVLDVNISTNDGLIDFTTDLSDIDDNLDDDEQTAEVLSILEKNLGDNLHIGTTISPLNISKSFEEYSFSFMPVTGVYANLTPHRGNGTDGLLEANGLAFGGVAFGISKKLNDLNYKKLNLSNINVGVGVKALKYLAFNENLDTATIVDNKDDLGDYLTSDDVAKEGTSITLDLGVQAEVYKNLDFGLSVMNIGSIGDEEKFEIPMTVNTGLSYTIDYPDRVFINKVVLAADYIDLLQAYNDKDIIKRTRLGANAHLIDGKYGSISAQLGLYQGYITYGLDLRLSVIKLAYTSYAEEVGAESGQYEDRRHMVSLSIGW